MKTIYKYSLPINGVQTILMPKGADILHVDHQDIDSSANACIWALVDTDATPVPRHFKVFGTGHEFDLDTDWQYLNTYQIGGFVWHVFEI